MKNYKSSLRGLDQIPHNNHPTTEAVMEYGKAGIRSGQKCGLWHPAGLTWVQDWDLHLKGCVTWGRWPILSESWFSYLKNG